MMEDFDDPNQSAAGKAPLWAKPGAFPANRRVRIQQGPLRGSEGTILDCPEDGRLLLALDGPLRGIYLKVDRSLVDLV